MALRGPTCFKTCLYSQLTDRFSATLPPPPLVHSNARTACRTPRKQLTHKGLLHDVTAVPNVDNSPGAHTFYVICTFDQTRQALL